MKDNPQRSIISLGRNKNTVSQSYIFSVVNVFNEPLDHMMFTFFLPHSSTLESEESGRPVTS